MVTATLSWWLTSGHSTEEVCAVQAQGEELNDTGGRILFSIIPRGHSLLCPISQMTSEPKEVTDHPLFGKG